MLLLGAATSRPESAFEATLARVARLPLFTGVPPARLERALARLVERKAAAGETIVRQGDRADAFYIVRDGEVIVSRTDDSGSELEVRRLGPDTVFGELGLLRGGVRTATVTAATETSLLVLGATDFLALVGAGGGGLRTRLLSLYETDEAASAAFR
jgi:CRP-like cAMP-binding protein